MCWISQNVTTYLLDRQEEKWEYLLTRKQCAKNCIRPEYSDDINGFMGLMEEVIDRFRGRLKRKLDKCYY